MTPEEYRKYLKTPLWLKKRAKVFRRDKDKCVRCKRSAEVCHHRTYERVGNERLADLESLCGLCHAFIHHRTSYDPAEILYDLDFLESQYEEAFKIITDLRDEIKRLKTL